MNVPNEVGDREGRMCGLLAVDIAGFGCRDDDTQCHLRAALYGTLKHAFSRSDIPWSECVIEDRGDGALIMIPSAIPVMRVLGPLPDLLSGLLCRYNRLSSDLAYMRLRAAAHVGYVSRDDYGIAGGAVVQLFRVLNAEPFRQRLASSGADLAFAVSGYVFDSIISRHPALIDPGDFQPLAIDAKETSTLAWVRLPGSTAPCRHPAGRLGPNGADRTAMAVLGIT
jgi:hypothetical protein